jgi:hypothetical protein
MSAVTRHAIVIERRFHDPPQSRHGGYACRPLARELYRPGHAASSRCLGFAHHPISDTLSIQSKPH